jgi:ribose transport system substrate-binding protein
MTVRRNIVVAASAVAMLALAGCSTGGDTGGDAGAEDREICYITAANSHPYVTPANEGAQAAADAAGIKLTIVSEEFAPATGAEQLDSCVARGVDGILLWPLDDNSYLPGLLKAKEAGIPVVAIDTTTGDDSMALIASFVGADKYNQGEISFAQLDTAMGGEGGVVILAGQAGNGTEIARTGGFMDALEASDSNLEVLATVNADFDQQKALVASRDLLTRFGDQIKGVYAEDDTMAKGFAQALAESGLSITPFVVGINGEKQAFEAIKAGTQYSTIIQPPFRNGELAIETLIKVMNGETVDAVVPLENTVVDATNVDSLEPAM